MLIDANPDHRESRILGAEKAIAQENWEEAIGILGELVEEKKTTSEHVFCSRKRILENRTPMRQRIGLARRQQRQEKRTGRI